MEMSQMVTQAMWERDSVLLQLPHVTKELAAKAAAGGVETIFDLQEMEVCTLKSCPFCANYIIQSRPSAASRQHCSSSWSGLLTSH